jgi:DNA polymerase-3 subunit delta
MSAEKILSSWKQKKFAPVYWLFGEESYYIDQLMQFAEHRLLPESEAAFNLTIFYGKDAAWADVINTCRRYPMFAERQVVLLKEAQQMKELDKLESYLENPMPSTILVIGYKGKGYDKRTKFYKAINQFAEVFESSKIKDEGVPSWISDLVRSKGLEIQPKAAGLLYEHLGADLSRIVSEVDKLTLNLGGKKTIDDDDIEKYVGISKEYNVTELQGAIAARHVAGALKIINYFEANPKNFAIHMVIPMLYAFFSKVYAVYNTGNRTEKTVKPSFYFNPVLTAQAIQAMNQYRWHEIECIILLLHRYNLKSVGVGDAGTEGPALMKEMVIKMMLHNN